MSYPKGVVVDMAEQMSEAAFLEHYAKVARTQFPRSEHTVDIALVTIRAGAR